MAQSRSGKLIGLLPGNEAVLECNDGIILFHVHNVHKESGKLKIGTSLYFFLDGYMGTAHNTAFYNAGELWTNRRSDESFVIKPIIYGLELYRKYFSGDIQHAIRLVNGKALVGKTTAGRLSYFLPKHQAVVKFKNGVGICSLYNVSAEENYLQLGTQLFFRAREFLGTKCNVNFYILSEVSTSQNDLDWDEDGNINIQQDIFLEFDGDLSKVVNRVRQRNFSTGTVIHCINEEEGIIHIDEKIFAWFHQTNIANSDITTVQDLLKKEVNFLHDCCWTSNSGKSGWGLASLVRPKYTQVKSANLYSVAWDNPENFIENCDPSHEALTLWNAHLLSSSSLESSRMMYMKVRDIACELLPDDYEYSDSSDDDYSD